jgi:hypothetical protein
MGTVKDRFPRLEYFHYRCIPCSRNAGFLTRHRHIGQADVYLSSLDAFHRQYIKPKAEARGDSRQRIRIAILDTGVAEGDSFIKPRIDDITQQRWEEHRKEVKKERRKGNMIDCPSKKEFNPIRIVESFVKPKDAGIDNCGHGTHTAGLLLKVAPDADIYVAKVACDIKFEDTNAVVEVSHGTAGCP